MNEPSERIEAFLAERANSRGLDPDIITGFNYSPLLISDIRAVLDALDTTERQLDYWLVPADQLDDPTIPQAVRVYHTREGRDAATRWAAAEARLSQAATGMDALKSRLWATTVSFDAETNGAAIHVEPRFHSDAHSLPFDLWRQWLVTGAAAGLLPTPQPDRACATHTHDYRMRREGTDQRGCSYPGCYLTGLPSWARPTPQPDTEEPT